MGNGPLKFVSCDSLETFKDGAVVEAQMAEQLRPTPEFISSPTPEFISKLLYRTFVPDT